jgi:iron complex outermembrane receptor protein
MTVRRTIAHILRGAVATGIGFGGTALAQEAPAPANTPMEEVQVTGSRIQRDGMTTPTPVTSVSMSDLHVLAPTTLGAAVTQLPQFINSSVPEGAPGAGWTGASGASILNLRGVGQNRTLVLLDGRRVVPSSRRGTLDVNLLPEPLVQRVEVVTGGASAAYGSDAVSGVVNFLLDTDFTGFKSNLQGGITEIGDNENYTVSLAGGLPLGERMHLIASADYYHADPITDATDRDWQQSWGVITNPLAGPGQPERITRPNVRSTQFTQGGLILSGPAAGQQFLPGGVLAPFVRGSDYTSATQSGGDGHDLSWYNYFTPETTRGSGFVHLTFDLTENANLFVQGLYGVNDTMYLSPPAGGQFSTWAATIFPNNAFLPAAVRQLTGNQSFRFGRAGDLDYGASKAITQDNTLKSFTTGLKAKLGEWKLDAYYQYGKTDSIIDMDNAIRLDRIYQAIDAVRAPSGEIVCNSTLMYPGNGCVPLNLFGVGAPSQAAIDWITQDISQEQVVQQHVADIALSGSPFDNWVGPVSFATGVSWRRDSFRQDVYPIELHSGTDMPTIGPALGYRGLPAAYSGSPNIFERGPSASPRGEYSVKEAFVEMQMPLLGETALSQSLEINTAVRFADYEGSGNVWAWKAGLDWQATSDIRFRFTRSRDVRAGSLSERFDSSRGPANVTDPEVLDPLTGRPVTYATTAINGGNPAVDPEKADTVTFGVVYQPTWLSGFAVSIDAFDIDIDAAIGQLGAQGIVDGCDEGATLLCSYIQRGADGNISLLSNLFINTDQAKTRGVDLETSFARPIELFGGGENVSIRLLTTFIDELSTTQAGAPKIDRAGQTGVSAGIAGAPDWQASLSLSYARGRLSATLQERFINGGVYDARWTEGVEIDDNRVDSSLITNLQVGYGGDLTSRGTYQVSLNVSNLFDEDPPLAATWGFTGSTQTNSSLFDIYGRRYNLGVRFNF